MPAGTSNPSYAALRAQHLKFWAWLGDISHDDTAVPVALSMYEGYRARGEFCAVDAGLHHMALNNFKTTMGKYPQAVARTSDVVRADFDIEL